MQCSHEVNGHCGKCARIVYKSDAEIIKEHHKVKNMSNYMKIEDIDITILFNHGFRVVSPSRKLRMLSH